MGASDVHACAKRCCVLHSRRTQQHCKANYSKDCGDNNKMNALPIMKYTVETAVRHSLAVHKCCCHTYKSAGKRRVAG